MAADGGEDVTGKAEDNDDGKQTDRQKGRETDR